MTKKQKKIEHLAKLHEKISGGKSQYAQMYFRKNRRIEMQKGR
jgi:hypothetical protein